MTPKREGRGHDKIITSTVKISADKHWVFGKRVSVSDRIIDAFCDLSPTDPHFNWISCSSVPSPSGLQEHWGIGDTQGQNTPGSQTQGELTLRDYIWRCKLLKNMFTVTYTYSKSLKKEPLPFVHESQLCETRV